MSTATVSSNYLSPEPVLRQAVEIEVQPERNGSQFNGSAVQSSRDDDRLLNARQVAAKLGVSERWVRDHTTRRNPRIRGIKLGPLMRYRREDVDVFMAELVTLPSSRSLRFGV
ncbi:MAG: helix-turn-helix domain-containing protein [Terracidiphilus sp.]